MNSNAILPICIAASLATSVTVVYLMKPAESDAAVDPDAELVAAVERLDATVRSLTDERDELARRLEDVESRASLVPAPSTRTEVGSVDAAIEQWMAEHEDELAARFGASGDGNGGVPVPERDLVATFQMLTEGDLDETEWTALWQELKQEGLADEMVAMFEQLVDERPNDADAHVGLAGAYLALTMLAGATPEAGHWGMQADRMLDQALEIDDQHWDARFTKAMSLSFWPDAFGKKAEAIQHFEILAQQQESLAVEDNFVTTYQMLGNMYLETGEKQKAIETWQKGLAMFPEDEDLLHQLELNLPAGG